MNDTHRNRIYNTHDSILSRKSTHKSTNVDSSPNHSHILKSSRIHTKSIKRKGRRSSSRVNIDNDDTGKVFLNLSQNYKLERVSPQISSADEINTSVFDVNKSISVEEESNTSKEIENNTKIPKNILRNLTDKFSDILVLIMIVI